MRVQRESVQIELVRERLEEVDQEGRRWDRKGVEHVGDEVVE